MRKKTKVNIKNFILDTVTFFAFVILVVSGLAVGRPEKFPLWLTIPAMIWVALFLYANCREVD